MGFRDDRSQRFQGAFDALRLDITMRDKTNRIRSSIERPDSVWFQRIAKLDGIHPSFFAIENDDVGFDGFWVNSQRWDLRDAFGEALRVLMIDD